MDPQGVCGEGLGVRNDHKSKVLYHFKPLIQVSKGPPTVNFDSLGVREIFFDFLGLWSKKVRTSLLDLLGLFLVFFLGWI